MILVSAKSTVPFITNLPRNTINRVFVIDRFEIRFDIKFMNREGHPLRKFNQDMAVWPNKCYFIRLRGAKEGQECASLGHLEIFSMSSGERQRKTRGTLKEQERYKRY